MTPLLLLLVIFLVGYLITHLFVQHIRKSQYMLIGLEYIFLGLLISPSLTNWLNASWQFSIPQLITPEVSTQLKPGVLLVIGVLGFITGLNFKFKYLFVCKKPDWLLTFFEILFSYLIIGGISFGLLYYFFFDGNNLFTLINSACMLSIAGVITSHSFIKNISEKYNLSGVLSQTFYNNSFLNINFGILLYGFLYGIFHQSTSTIVKFTPVEWVVVSIFFSSIMGLLFFLFLGNEKDESKIYLAILGIIIFSSGAAYILNFSPLYINFIIGAILTNVSKIGGTILDVLKKITQPISVLVAIFAGVFWVPSTFLLTAIAILLFALLRILAKATAGFMSYAALRGEYYLPKVTGLGLLSTDVVICAMVVEYGFLFDNNITHTILSAIFASVIIFNFYGFYKAKNLLIDFDDIKNKNL